MRPLTLLPSCRGDPIPSTLIEKVDEYIPDDLTKLLSSYKVTRGPSSHAAYGVILNFFL